ncbi:MAG TPA: hypothetical protein VFB20_15165 [Burkholderiales bacterium]|nr:hypothetical protein [Burkholderiales bacterium]
MRTLLAPAVPSRVKFLLAAVRRAFVVAGVSVGIGVIVTGLFVFAAIMRIVRRFQQ